MLPNLVARIIQYLELSESNLLLFKKFESFRVGATVRQTELKRFGFKIVRVSLFEFPQVELSIDILPEQV